MPKVVSFAPDLKPNSMAIRTENSVFVLSVVVILVNLNHLITRVRHSQRIKRTPFPRLRITNAREVNQSNRPLHHIERSPDKQPYSPMPHTFKNFFH
jgi:hypothetical protein